MKTPKFDGSTNLEQALGIKPDNNEMLDIEMLDDIDMLSDATDIVPMSDNGLLLSSTDLTEVDQEIRDDIAELYDRAVSAFDDNMDQIESMEPKYVSRAMEVSKGYLDMALDAVKLKQKQKEHADKMKIASDKAGTTQNAKTINNNIVVANRNDILRDAMNGIIDGKKVDDTKN